jgi:hypothetical protein
MAEEPNDDDNYDESELMAGGSTVGSMAANHTVRIIGVIIAIMLLIIVFT